MTLYRVSVAVFVVLVALAGCKKKLPADAPGEAQDGTPADVPARRVVEALDRMPAEVAQDKVPFYALGKLAESMPQPAAPGGIALDATDHRAAIDASVAKLWAAWETFPERMRQKVIRDQTAALLKQGMALDAARAEAERRSQPLPPLKVTAPKPDLNAQFFSRLEADVADGTADVWNQNGGMNVAGSVRYSESLTIHCNGSLTVGLRGTAPKLVLNANGEVIADLIELNVSVVEVRPNGALFLRVGPATSTVRITGNAVGGLILTRGNTELKVTGPSEHDRRVAVIAY